MSTRHFPLLTSALLLALSTAAAAANDPQTTSQTEPPVDTLEPAHQIPPVDTTEKSTAQTDDLTDTSDVDLDPLAAEDGNALDPASDVDADDTIMTSDDVAAQTDDDAAADEPDVAGDDVAATESDDQQTGDDGDPMTDPDADVGPEDIARAEDDMSDELAAGDDVADPVDHTDAASMTTPQAEPPLPGRTGAQLAKATREVGDLDGNGDGSLSADEVPQSIALSERFDDYDIDNDDKISLNEYQSWMAAQDVDTSMTDEQRVADDNVE